MSQQALALWKSQLPSYEKIISRCCFHIQIPLTEFLPTDFQQKKQQLKEALEMKQLQLSQQYISLIGHLIEGKKNKSSIQLADYFVQEFGGSLKYWQNIILDIGQQVTYTPDLTLWHVRKLFQEKLYVDPQNLSNYRRLCKFAKSYLSALINLNKYITKFDLKKDSLSKIDELFKKVKSAQEKYLSFCQQMDNIEQSNTFDQLSNNISQKSKQNALKNIYRYTDTSRPEKNEKVRNTLFNYNFWVKNKQVNERVSEPTKNIKQSKQLVGQKLQLFEKVLKNIKQQRPDINNLRFQFINKKKIKDQSIAQTKINVTTIWDKDYYFSYVAYPIQLLDFDNYTQPFQKKDWVNYEIASDQEFQELLGEDVDNNEEMSYASELSKNSFIVSDDYLSEDENIDGINKQLKPAIYTTFGERWSFSKENQQKKMTYSMLIIDQKLKLPIEIYERDQIQQVLFKIVDGKDKSTIMDILSKQKIKVSKAKMKQFLSKKCRQVVNDSNKIIYRIIQSEQQNIEQNQKQNQYIPGIQEEQDIKQDLDDTKMYDPQCLSQPNQRMPTRRSKRQQSQKLENGNQNVKRTRSSRNKQDNKIKSV